MAIQLECTFIWYKLWKHKLYRNISDFVPHRGQLCSSRNVVSKLGHEVLERMPGINRSTPTPTPPGEAVPTVATAPVSASLLAMPDPNPSRALAFFVDPQTPLEDLPCFTPGPLGAGMVLDLSRVFIETGCSCSVVSRYEIACALGWVATKVPPRPGAESWPMAFETAEHATTVQAGASRV